METKRIVKDCITGEEILEDLETDLLLEMQAEAIRLASLPTLEQMQEIENEKQLAKEAAIAKLAALGLTTDDLKALGL